MGAISTCYKAKKEGYLKGISTIGIAFSRLERGVATGLPLIYYGEEWKMFAWIVNLFKWRSKDQEVHHWLRKQKKEAKRFLPIVPF